MFLKKLLRLFPLDIRSLALFRISIGLLSICYFSQIYFNWEKYFSSTGVYLIDKSEPLSWARWQLFSLFSDSYQTWVLYFGVITSILFVLGRMTRLSAFIIFTIMVSIEHKNPYVSQVGTELLRAVLMWSIFLPLDRCWVIGKKNSNPKSFTIVSWATIALMMQITFLYFFAFLHKLNDAWMWSGLGIYHSLIYSPYTRPISALLLDFPNSFPLLAIFTQAVRLIGGLVIWIPRNRLSLGPIICLLVFVHLVFSFLFTIGLFSYVCISLWLVMIPTSWWGSKQKILYPEIKNENRLIKAIIISLSLYIFVINIVPFNRKFSSQGFYNVSQTLGCWQWWGMFAQMPLRHRWLNLMVMNEKNEIVAHWPDVNFDENSNRPISSIYQSEISRRYHEALLSYPQEHLIRAYAKYNCPSLENKKRKFHSVKLTILESENVLLSSEIKKYKEYRSWMFSCAYD